MYLYHTVASEGKTIDFYLSKSRDKKAAKYFFNKALAFSYVSKPRVITVDKNPAYPLTIQALKEKNHMLKDIILSVVQFISAFIRQPAFFYETPSLSYNFSDFLFLFLFNCIQICFPLL